MSSSEWQKASIERAIPTALDDKHVEMEWKLKGVQDPAWDHAFHAAAQPRVGAGDFVYGLDPRVSGDRIRWTVPTESTQESTEEVLKRVAAANKRFREVLDERAAHQARQQGR
jgi:hypothetical protein